MIEEVPVKTQWLVAISRLLTKYFRSCTDCKGGLCPKCYEFKTWRLKLDKLIEDAKGK